MTTPRQLPTPRSLARVLPVKLTPRELQVWALLPTLGRAQIAARLGIAPQTVGCYLVSLYAKIGARCRTQAAIMWLYGAEAGYRVEVVDRPAASVLK